MPQSHNVFSQRLIPSLKAEYENICPVDLGDFDSRQQNSAFGEEALRFIDILVTAPTPNYGYTWDVVRLAHLSARDYAVPMDTDVKLLKKINIVKVEQITPEIFSAVFLRYGSYYQLNLENPGDWVKLLVDKSIAVEK